jgi:hypothetical protein
MSAMPGQSQSYPSRQKRQPAQRRDRAQPALVGDAEGVQAAGKQDDAKDEKIT